MHKFIRYTVLVLALAGLIIATHPATPARVMWNSKPPASDTR